MVVADVDDIGAARGARQARPRNGPAAAVELTMEIPDVPAPYGRVVPEELALELLDRLALQLGDRGLGRGYFFSSFGA